MKQPGILFYLLTWRKGQKSESIIFKTCHNFRSYPVSRKDLVLKMEESCLSAHKEVN